MKYRLKKITAWLLVLLMIVNMTPVSAFAAGEDGDDNDIIDQTGAQNPYGEEFNLVIEIPEGVTLTGNNYYIVYQSQGDTYQKELLSGASSTFNSFESNPVVLLKSVSEGQDAATREGTVHAVYPYSTTDSTGTVEGYLVGIGYVDSTKTYTVTFEEDLSNIDGAVPVR